MLEFLSRINIVNILEESLLVIYAVVYRSWALELIVNGTFAIFNIVRRKQISNAYSKSIVIHSNQTLILQG